MANKRKTMFPILCFLLLCNILLFPAPGECQEFSGTANMVEIEYRGRIIQVDIADLILMSDGHGGQRLELFDSERYADQFNDSFDAGGAQQITRFEYEEERRARRWTNIVEDLTLREIDEKALELVREFGEARNAVPPMIGSTGTLVLAHSTYIPRIVSRPMHVTSIILQPGEIVTGVHPGDPVRWSFVPSVSGSGANEQMHVLIKPLMPDISTNLIINTDRRTYHLDLVASATHHIPSVSFTYPADTLAGWDSFIQQRRAQRQRNIELSSGHSISPEDLHLDYEIRGRDSLRWKPIRVWDDGVKTYIQFRRGSMRRSVEAPVLVVLEGRREVLVNYRVVEDMYIVDRVFDTAALIAGTGANQDRVVIRRLDRR